MKTIKISEETYEKICEKIEGQPAKKDFEFDSYAEMVGKKFFFREVTYHLVGRVRKQVGAFLELEDASWIADSGRFMNALKEGKLSEVEPVGQAFINLNSVTDFFPWIHDLPEEQK